MIDHEDILVALHHARAIQEAEIEFARKPPRPLMQTAQALLEQLQHPDHLPVDQATSRFVQYVESLGTTRARQLLAVMYAGRGDGQKCDVAHADRVYGHYQSARACAEQMAAKWSLVAYLQRGMTAVRPYLLRAAEAASSQ